MFTYSLPKGKSRDSGSEGLGFESQRGHHNLADMTPTTKRVFQIFKELNQIPRPSHHEERVADYLCQFAERLGLTYKRDKENCVVISKPATPGHEGAEPIVLLNHMDMVCVGMSDPLNDPIQAYVEDGWMKARGTSLGADNGIGLSMALAVLESNDIVHGPMEVITTTNEEDGMSGASQLSSDFLRGRKVINLDSEDYDGSKADWADIRVSTSTRVAVVLSCLRGLCLRPSITNTTST